MLKNPCYVYGPKCCYVPVNLNFGDYMLDKLRSHREKIALINGETDERITYNEILQQAMNFAVSLSNMGVRKGDVIAIFSESRQEFWSAVIGVICTGAVLTTISTAYTKGELKHVISISKPKYIICSPTTYKNHEITLKSFDHVQKIIVFGNKKRNNDLLFNNMALACNGFVKNVIFDDFVTVDVDGRNDTLFILYSSGTTGLPKGVMLSHLNALTVCNLPPTQKATYITINIAPWYHTMGLMGTLFGLTIGRTSVYLAKFEVDFYLKTIEKYKVVNITVVPPVLVAVCKTQAKYDLSSVMGLYSGAAPLHKNTVNVVLQKFPNVKMVYQGYGASETSLAVLKYNDDDEETKKIGSVGKVVPGIVIKVVDIETREPLGPNKSGEICVKGSLLMKGYIGKGLGDDFDKEGFYKTGDVGYYDEDEYFYISDRLKELIKYKGHQVPPAELEAVLLQHEAIRDAGVVGVPHKEEEVPLAFVVLQPGRAVMEQNIKDFVAERLSNPKHLRGGVRFVEQIPKNSSGKILRSELRKMAKSEKSKL